MNEQRDSGGSKPSLPAPSNEPQLHYTPPIDIYETPDGLVLYADLPGVTLEHLDLQVQDNRLTLYGRTLRDGDDSAETVYEERQPGNFLRSFILSDEVDHDRIQASLQHGVLRVELPRTPRPPARQIKVSAG